MKRSIAVPILLAWLLAACQGHNPYTAESLPLPPAPAGAASTHDLSAYPATPRDFGRYRSWSWLAPPVSGAALDSLQLQEILAGGLEQRGLRQTQPGVRGDLQARASVRQEQRLYRIGDDFGGWYGYGPHRHGRYDRYGMYGSVPLVRTERRDVLIVDIELIDAASGQAVWRGAAEVEGGADASGDNLRQATGKALERFPPS